MNSPTPPEEGRSWWPFPRRKEEEPRLGPATGSGFAWLDGDAEETPPSAGGERPDRADPAEAPVAPAAPEATESLAGPTSTQAEGAEEPVAAAAPEPQQPTAPAAGIAGRDEDGLLVLGAGTAATLGAPPAGGNPGELPREVICRECRGSYGPDGYCENCGAKAADPRAHFVISAGSWLGGVCDRGVRHPSNEDALALTGEVGPQGPRAAIVVCDGVSTAPHSAEASMLAARAAVQVLAGSHARGVGGVEAALIGAIGQRLAASADAAAEAVAEVSERVGGDFGGPSATFVAAVVEGDVAVVGNVGDSRAYWLPDDGEALLLTADDSWAAEEIRRGVPREDAEAGPRAHTITRWLGADSPGHAPTLATVPVAGPGWLMVCSDGLWNYASDAASLGAVVADAATALRPGADGGDDVPQRRPADDVPDATELATALVNWANAQGGHDNVTVALARLEPARAAATPTDQED